MIKTIKVWLKPRLVYFVSRHLNLGFKPCRAITTQEIRARFRDAELVFRADFRTPLYETINEVLAYDCYQLAKVPFSTSNEAVVIDIGANIGVGSVALARLTRGRVYAFEPITANYQQLQFNLQLNGIENVECHKAAVGTVAGVATMAINPDESVSSYIPGKGQARIPSGFTTEKVDVIGFDDLLQQVAAPVIDLVKIDCEGAEYGLIDALSKLEHTRIRAITMEVHDLDRERNCSAMRHALTALGYTVSYKSELLGRPVLHHLLAIRP